ncbi:ABC transporter ATP-binding protein [Clostridium rectalis]|uniref:ABC transporter ATP-binding protein n=1 Tax=Clostridium rectalis TaxID=2040295 RepID=UPI0013DDCD63|nr:ABC transporter ATP-binding protein [Clostridium rectalis]
MLINNKSVLNMNLKERATKMAVLAQTSNQNLNFKVIDIVLMRLYATKKSIFSYTKSEIYFALSALDKLGIAHLSSRIFSTLYGGERQRALITRAICQNVQLLVLDEPLNHLDIFYQLEIMKLVKSFGLTVVCVLHDFIINLKLCDKLVIMKEGSVYATGHTKDLINSSILKDVFKYRCNYNFSKKYLWYFILII